MTWVLMKSLSPILAQTPHPPPPHPYSVLLLSNPQHLEQWLVHSRCSVLLGEIKFGFGACFGGIG